MQVQYSNILILGAGLAGLCAAWNIKRHAPTTRTIIVSPRTKPLGSSFSNQNNALGIAVPGTEEEQHAFVQRTIELAHPGKCNPHLVQILAQEAHSAFVELQGLGFHFTTNKATNSLWHPCCGCTQTKAAIFQGLAQAYTNLTQKLAPATQQVEATILGLLIHNNRCAGAWGVDATGKTTAFVASNTIMALGGAAPLYRYHVAGRGNTGHALGMLHEAGVALGNTHFLQFMWFTEQGQFIDIGSLPMNARCNGEEGPKKTLRTARSTHCPALYGQEDSCIDHWLLAGLDEQGGTVVTHQGIEHRLYLKAQASNGGAIVDGHGRTSMAGLFAVGECATGMHGANRIGGAMVASTQVFGRRAALAALSPNTLHAPQLSEGEIQDLVKKNSMGSGSSTSKHETISKGLQRHASFILKKAPLAFTGQLKALLHHPERETVLHARGALAILEQHSLYAVTAGEREKQWKRHDSFLSVQ